MQMLFKQRFFSWFDSYDIYDSDGNVLFEVKGKLSWGHRLEIYDAFGQHLGTVQEKVLTLLPRFQIYIGDTFQGEIRKEFTLFKPVFTLNFKDWVVQGDFWQWEYQVTDGAGRHIFQASKQLLRMTDTYSIDVPNPDNALVALMIVLAIDAAKCSSKSK